MSRGLFVYCICGHDQLEVLNTSLRFLKRASRQEIVVIQIGASAPINHDQVLSIEVPRGLSNYESVLYVKTSLPSIIALPEVVSCYLDTDQIAVSRDVDEVFTHFRPPITFARDHLSIDRFSRCAVRCGCQSPPCSHLRQAIEDRFGVSITSPNWRHWNGGLFLFDQSSVEFTSLWREFTLLAFDDPYWETRDQGTLAAAAWSRGLQLHTVVPGRFNHIVDRFRGHPEPQRQRLRTTEYAIDTGYEIDGSESSPTFLHFINGGVNRPGWKNWDRAEAWLQSVADSGNAED